MITSSTWKKMNVPLVPDEGDLAFQEDHIKEGGKTLILGVTPQLCILALKKSKSVIAVDFAEDVIASLAIEDVEYVHMDWIEFLNTTTHSFDTIITDGGLLCLDFPEQWNEISKGLHARLNPGGMFTARVYINIDRPPKDTYQNPNLNRFVTSMNAVDKDWMVRPSHEAYAKYDMHYSFPPEKEVLSTFTQFSLVDRRTPEYEEGERFISYAWQRV